MSPNQTLSGRVPGGEFGLSVAYTSDGHELAIADRNFGSQYNGGVHLYRRASISAQFSASPNQTLESPDRGNDFGYSIVYRRDGRQLFVSDRWTSAGTGSGVGVVWAFVR